jgi:hypothetical protein
MVAEVDVVVVFPDEFMLLVEDISLLQDSMENNTEANNRIKLPE